MDEVTPCYLERLPLELQFMIMIQLSLEDLKNLSLTASHFNRLYHDWNFWADKAHHDFQFPWSLFESTKSLMPCRRYAEIQEYSPDYNYCNWILDEAARHNNLNAAKQAVNQGADNFDGALYLAALYNCIHVFKWLITQDQVFIPWPLIVAARYDHGQIIKCIFEHCDVPIPSLNDALDIATANGHINIIKDLLYRGATNLNYNLTQAARSGRLEIVTLLVAYGATGLDHALLEAAKYGHFDVVQYLVDHGAGQKIGTGRMAMDYLEAAKALATGPGYDDIVRYLRVTIRQRDCQRR